MDEDSFALRHPLVDVIPGERVSKFFDGKRIDKQVEDYFLGQMIMQLHDFGKCYAPSGHIRGELPYRPIAAALLPIFTRLAPRQGELLEGEDPKYKDKPVSAGFGQRGEVYMETGEEDGSTIDLDVSDLSGWSWTGTGLEHEDGTFLKVHEALDIRGYVRSVTELSLIPRSVIEFKAVIDWMLCMHQALYYGSEAAIDNAERGFFKKIYVAVMGIGWLGCAEIDPVGSLELNSQNNITVAEVRKFKNQVRAKCELLRSKKRSTREAKAKELEDEYINKDDKNLAQSLKAKVKKRMDAAAHDLNVRSSQVHLPIFKKATKLLIATATYRETPVSLLRFPLPLGAAIQGDGLAVSGIARIVFGDRVLRWKLPALLAHAAKRDEEARAQAKALLAKRDEKARAQAKALLDEEARAQAKALLEHKLKRKS